MRTFTQEALLLSVAVLSIQKQLQDTAKGVRREIEKKTSIPLLCIFTVTTLCARMFAVCGV